MTKRMLAASAAIGLAGSGLMVALSSPSHAVGTGVYLRTTTASVNLSGDGSPVALKQVTVPAGTWIITAKANPVNFGGADYVRCRILVGGVQKDAGATLVGNAFGGPTNELGPSVAEIALQTAVSTTGSKTVKLDCLHDFAYSGEYVDPGASLMVEQAPGPIG